MVTGRRSTNEVTAGTQRIPGDEKEGHRKARPEIKKFFIQHEFSRIVAEFGAVVAYDVLHRFVMTYGVRAFAGMLGTLQ